MLPLPINQRDCVPVCSGAASVALLTNLVTPEIFMSPTLVILARGPSVKVFAELLLNVASDVVPPIAALMVISL